jgi:hypothetical protein
MSNATAGLSARLADLPSADRQWLYDQLSDGERLQLFDLLAALPEIDHGPSTPSSPGSTAPIASAEDVVAGAGAWEITQALLDEPDWIVALLLSRRRWPWVAEYFDGIGHDRMERLNSLAAAAGEASRERAYAAAVAAFAARIRTVAASAERRRGEDGARLMGVRPVDE